MKEIKTYTITTHCYSNCGSYLQSFALQQFLIINDFENEIVNYIPPYKKQNFSIKVFMHYIIFSKQNYFRNHKFKELRKKMHLTNKLFKSNQDLSILDNESSIFIVGSDQIWNKHSDFGNDEAFYLSFVKKGKKISYAASIGYNDIDNNELKELHSKIKEFDFISTREPLVSFDNLGELSRLILYHVCDPVFLINKDIYNQFIKNDYKYKDHVVVYFPKNIELANKIANHYACNENKVVLLAGNYNKIKADIHVPECSPIEFLSYIKYAKIVISTSFHATAFSIVYNKDFLVVDPNENDSRFDSVLDKCNLKKRIIRDYSELDSLTAINYDEVNYLINKWAKISGDLLINFLKRCINE